MDVADLVEIDPTQAKSKWTHRYVQDGFADRIQLKPRDANFRFTGWEPLILPATPPVHKEKSMPPTITYGGSYSINYSGSLDGEYSLAVDFGVAGEWLGVQTAVLFLCLDLAPGRAYQIPPDWSLTVDVASIFQWSALVFSRAIGRVSGIPSSIYMKYVGQLLPDLGVMTIGFKVHGVKDENPTQNYGLNYAVNLNASLSSIYGRGELVGRPNIDSPESDSDG